MRRICYILIFLLGGLVSARVYSTPVTVDAQKGICRIEGIDFPAVGLGTYLLLGDVCAEAIHCAVKNNYRIIDTATYYRNFDGIAKALKNLDRRQFYIISKVWHDKQTPEGLREDIEFTLKQLQTEYLDAYLLHWPNSETPIEATLATMDALRRQGKIRHIGLSNVNANHVKRALEIGIPITWVQVEMHPYFYDAQLIQFCQEHFIVVQAWAPFARGTLNDDPFLTGIGEKYGKTASQIAIRWIVQHGCVPLPCSKNEKHIRENCQVMDFSLSQEEMESIDSRARAGKRERFSTPVIGFEDEFDFSYEQCWPKK